MLLRMAGREQIGRASWRMAVGLAEEGLLVKLWTFGGLAFRFWLSSKDMKDLLSSGGSHCIPWMLGVLVGVEDG